jgi:hypothetical protein
MIEGDRMSRVERLSTELLKHFIEQGSFYAALDLPPEASGREILDALRQRRREYPDLDPEWNNMHTVLTQQRSLYNQALVVRDQTARRLESEFGRNGLSRYPRHIIWSRLWGKPSNVGMIKREAKRIIQEAKQWQQSEDAYQRARAQLAREYGEVVFDLLNLDLLHRNLPDHPDALLHFAEEMQKAAREVIQRLLTLDITADEVRSGQATRTIIRKSDDCKRCRGKGKITLRSKEIAKEAGHNAELHEQICRELLRSDQKHIQADQLRRITALALAQSLNEARHSTELREQIWREVLRWPFTSSEMMPWANTGLFRAAGGIGTPVGWLRRWLDDREIETLCPICCSEVTFRLPSVLSKGRIIRGDLRDSEEKVYARVKGTTRPTKPVIQRATVAAKMAAAIVLILEFLRLIPSISAALVGIPSPPFASRIDDDLRETGLRGLAFLLLISALIWGAFNHQLVWRTILTQPPALWAVLVLLSVLFYYATGPHQSEDGESDNSAFEVY